MMVPSFVKTHLLPICHLHCMRNKHYLPCYRFGELDTVGCGIYLPTGEIFFTKNGIFLGIVGQVQSRNKMLPTIGIFGYGKICCNLGRDAFEFAWNKLPVAQFGKTKHAPNSILKHKRQNTFYNRFYDTEYDQELEMQAFLEAGQDDDEYVEERPKKRQRRAK